MESLFGWPGGHYDAMMNVRITGLAASSSIRAPETQDPELNPYTPNTRTGPEPLNPKTVRGAPDP